MLRCMFWNLRGKQLAQAVRAACLERDVDLLILAECSDDLLQQLGQGPQEVVNFPYSSVNNWASRVRFFTRLPPTVIRPGADYGKHLSLVEIDDHASPKLLVAGVHLPSKQHWRDSEQALNSTDVTRNIADEEARRGHQRTVVVGDFNMNPFEDGICGAQGFHGVMTRAIAGKGARQISGKRFDYFYNPMWNFRNRSAPSI